MTRRQVRAGSIPLSPTGSLHHQKLAFSISVIEHLGMASKIVLGIDRLLNETALQKHLKGYRIGFLGHPASVTADLRHSMDAVAALLAKKKLGKLSAAFGPQHGMRGDRQYNMQESGDYTDPIHKIPVFSLYGKVRRPTKDMLDQIDLLLIDLQDLGCRIYTYHSTLVYVLEDCARAGKKVVILDRPNPAGRAIEGNRLESQEFYSFVGASNIPMRYGMTVGETAKWYVAREKLKLDLTVVAMKGYDPEKAPGFGWPLSQMAWVNPSPNAASLNMARAYPGTVLIEGTTLSEGRGTTIPLEVLGAPYIDAHRVFEELEKFAPKWLAGCALRPCYFVPMFNEYTGELCQGLQIHTDASFYDPKKFKPYRLVAGILKILRKLYPDQSLWHSHPYEYENDRIVIDVISGGTTLRQWIDDPKSKMGDLEAWLKKDETEWSKERKPFLVY